jgi:Do/DeqQ family serine protease
MPKALTFILQSITAGLALAFLLVLINPAWLVRGGPYATVANHSPDSYAEAVAVAAPAVVNLYSSRNVEEHRNPLLSDPLFRRFLGEDSAAPRIRKELSLGSGVIMDGRGYLLTNSHVVAGADTIQVGLQDGRNSVGTIVGVDPDTDLAVIKLELGAVPTIRMGDSERLRVGDVVLAIGNPFGVGQTVTQGIVSATGRNRLGINTFENFIQTDAAINPGNSGGALVNAAGELIGINTAIVSQSGGAQGIGFAIPVAMARQIMQSLIEHGAVVRGWLGIEAYDVSPEYAARLRLENGGALVKGVVLNSPADEAGVEPNDVVTGINGAPINDSHQGLEAITRLQPGTTARIELIRKGRKLALQATVAERPQITLQ